MAVSSRSRLKAALTHALHGTRMQKTHLPKKWDRSLHTHTRTIGRTNRPRTHVRVDRFNQQRDGNEVTHTGLLAVSEENCDDVAVSH